MLYRAKLFLHKLLKPFFEVFLKMYFFDRTIEFNILSPKGKLGQYLIYIEPVLRERRNLSKQNKLIIINPGKVPNSFMESMYKRYVQIYNISELILGPLVLKMLYSLEYQKSKMVIPILYGKNLGASTKHLWASKGICKFTEEELIRGGELLKEMGLSGKDRFVVLGVREAHYYRDNVDLDANPEASEEYFGRNPDISNYALAVEFLNNKGIKVIKQGFPGGPPCKIDGVIDYANNHRSEFGDIYLHAHALFTISGCCGNFHISDVFNVPIILTDSYDVQNRPVREGSLYISQKYFDSKQKRYLSIKEMLDGGVWISSEAYLKENALTMKKNTPEEILEVVKEMHENLENGSVEDSKTIALRKKFDSCFGVEHQGYKMPGDIGREWIKQNEFLLD